MILISAILLGPADAVPAGETKAQSEAAALALHRRLDANHDGFVTYAEVRGAALAMVIPNAKVAASLPNDPASRAEFDRADSNHDGRISEEEEIAAADRAFVEADIDHDGVLSSQEWGAYAARALHDLEQEIPTWKAMPCQPGAVCSTAK